MRALHALVSILTLTTASLPAGENLLQQGDFAGGELQPWIMGKEALGINIGVEKPADAFGEGKNWVHVSDQTEAAAASMRQELPQAITNGRLSFKLHIIDHAAAAWFILGRNQVSKSDDIGIGLKISSAGGLIVSAKDQRVSDSSGNKMKFTKGETYHLYCEFGPAEQAGMTRIKMGQVGGDEFFNGTAELSEEFGTLMIRTHKEQGGSDFYVTDLVLSAQP